MEALIEQSIQCPHCWESFTVVVDTSVAEQDYIEDCFVCCRPIRIQVHCGEGGSLEVVASREED